MFGFSSFSETAFTTVTNYKQPITRVVLLKFKKRINEIYFTKRLNKISFMERLNKIKFIDRESKIIFLERVGVVNHLGTRYDR